MCSLALSLSFPMLQQYHVPPAGLPQLRYVLPEQRRTLPELEARFSLLTALVLLFNPSTRAIRYELTWLQFKQSKLRILFLRYSEDIYLRVYDGHRPFQVLPRESRGIFQPKIIFRNQT